MQKKWVKEKKKTFRKKLVFFVDKLNIIDFNIFNILKLIFTCESVAYLLQNSFVNVRISTQLFFLLVFYFDCLFEDLPVVCLLYFVLSLLDTFLILFPEIIVRLIFLCIVKPLSHDTSERLEIIMNIVYHLSWILWCIDLAQHCVFISFQ